MLGGRSEAQLKAAASAKRRIGLAKRIMVSVLGSVYKISLVAGVRTWALKTGIFVLAIPHG